MNPRWVALVAILLACMLVAAPISAKKEKGDRGGPRGNAPPADAEPQPDPEPAPEPAPAPDAQADPPPESAPEPESESAPAPEPEPQPQPSADSQTLQPTSESETEGSAPSSAESYDAPPTSSTASTSPPSESMSSPESSEANPQPEATQAPAPSPEGADTQTDSPATSQPAEPSASSEARGTNVASSPSAASPSSSPSGADASIAPIPAVAESPIATSAPASGAAVVGDLDASQPQAGESDTNDGVQASGAPRIGIPEDAQGSAAALSPIVRSLLPVAATLLGAGLFALLLIPRTGWVVLRAAGRLPGAGKLLPASIPLRVAAVAKQNPGIQRADLIDEVNHPWPMVAFASAIAERRRMLVCQNTEAGTGFWSQSTAPAPAVSSTALLRQSAVAEAARALRLRPHATVLALEGDCSLSQLQLAKAMVQLEQAGLVEVEGQGLDRKFKPTEELAIALRA